MRFKILALGLVFLILIACEKGIENPYSPEPSIIPQSNLPEIVLFTAVSPLRTRDYTLSWKVLNATTVNIGYNLGNVAAEGTMELNLPLYLETITYILVATNNYGESTKSIIFEPERATFEITVPEIPVFHYSYNPTSIYTYSESVFTVVFTETNGIGGSILLKVATAPCGNQWQYPTDGQPISYVPYEVIVHTFSIRVYRIECKPTHLTVGVKGYDNNNMNTDEYVSVPFIWGN